MEKILLASCLMLVVALSSIYEIEGTQFVLPMYLNVFPKTCKEYQPYAYKGMLGLVNDLEYQCPQTPEFKAFFLSLKDYMSWINSAPASAKDTEDQMQLRTSKLVRTMAALDGSRKGTSKETIEVVYSLLSMMKTKGTMEKSGAKEMTFEQRKQGVSFMVDWSRAIGKFAKVTAEKKGKTIDLSSFGIDHHKPSGEEKAKENKGSKQVKSEAGSSDAGSSKQQQGGGFVLPLYFKEFPKTCGEFPAFAYKGMMKYMESLEGMCPTTPEFKTFFTQLKDYMNCINSPKDNQVEISLKSEKLVRAMAAIDGSKNGSSEETWFVAHSLLSMGKTFAETKKSGAKKMEFEQRKELVDSMIKWTRGIGKFAKVTAEKKGKSIDLSSFGIDYTDGGKAEAGAGKPFSDTTGAVSDSPVGSPKASRSA